MPVSLFISHGSPMLALAPGESGPALQKIASSLPRPSAILVVSAHWESPELCISSAAKPATWHDFNGFPNELYQVQYPAPGSVELAQEVQRLLAKDDLPCTLDERRPFDHGTWVPLSLMYPEADIPVVQLSLAYHCGPAFLTRLGQILSELRQQGVLLVGSGSITHNLRELNWYGGDYVDDWALEFRNWMLDKIQERDLLSLISYRRLAPHAERCHPSEEHLLPLFFALGAGKQLRLEHSGFTYGSLGMDIYRFD